MAKTTKTRKTTARATALMTETLGFRSDLLPRASDLPSFPPQPKIPTAREQLAAMRARGGQDAADADLLASYGFGKRGR